MQSTKQNGETLDLVFVSYNTSFDIRYYATEYITSLEKWYLIYINIVYIYCLPL